MAIAPLRICYTCGRQIACREGKFEPPDGAPTIWFCTEHGGPIFVASIVELHIGPGEVMS